MKAMDLAIKNAEISSYLGFGGPFGAAIVKSDTRELVCVTTNEVLTRHDPTAHAEITCIRRACEKLQTHDLTGYTIYATGYPCPMCMSAIIWANLDSVIYAGDVKDAENIGFRDDFIYNFIREGCIDDQVLPVIWSVSDRPKVQELYKQYQENKKEMY